jgi:hypothetical protein
MYLSVNNCKTQGLRKAFINSMTNDRHYKIKELKRIDKNLARTYTNTKYYGGSLKSFWQKVKGFGKRVLTSFINANKIFFNSGKKLLDFSRKPGVKKIIDNVGNAIGKVVGVPTMGSIINAGLDGAKTATDGLGSIIEAIKSKNPSLALNEIKGLIQKVKDTVSDAVNKIEMTPAEKEQLEKNKDKVLNKLPDVIKNFGFAKVDKAAGYLPFLDVKTYSETERTGKGGRVLKPRYRFVKPKIITLHKDIFSKLPAYDPDIVGEVGGRVYLGSSGRCGTGTDSGRVDLGGTRLKPVGKFAKMTVEEKNEYIKNHKPLTIQGPGGTKPTKEQLEKMLKEKQGGGNENEQGREKLLQFLRAKAK